MAYKNILTVLAAQQDMAQLDAAMRVTQDEDGHLDVLCLGIDISQPGYYFPGGTPYVFHEGMETAENDAAALRDAVATRLAGATDLRWHSEAAVAQLGGVTSLVGVRARYADLTVLSQPYGEDASGSSETVIEAAMFEGGCPVLVAPPEGLTDTAFRKVLIAWNQSSEAMTAVRRALPLLRRAESVEIAIIDPGRAGVEGSDPGGALATMLTRHGVRAEIAVIARTAPTISDEINRRAIDIEAGLIVMGAYGHSRFRQAILGGATRNMLEKSKLPIFMAR